MYVPKEFAGRPEDALALVETYPFGVLVSCEAETPVGTHLPFMLDRRAGPKGRLLAHFARANPHWEGLDGRTVMVIFAGPHAYVSPTWYRTRASVPTWNYAAVHIYGQIRTFDDPARLADLVARLSDHHELGNPEPWSLSELPARQRDSMLGHIVGLELDIEQIDAKHKLSQNRPVEDRQRVVAALRSRGWTGDLALADYMAGVLGIDGSCTSGASGEGEREG